MKPAKPLPKAEVPPVLAPNVEVPPVAVAAKLVGDAKFDPKIVPFFPNVGLEANEGAAPNVLPKGVVLAVVVAVIVVLKLLPNGDVVVVLLPRPPPNVLVLEAEVVAGVGAFPNVVPNGLEDAGGGLPKILAAGATVVLLLPKILFVGADVVIVLPKMLVIGADVVVTGIILNPLPNGLGMEVVDAPDALVLGTEVVVVELVLVVAPNPLPNAFVGAAVEVAEPPKGIVPVVEATPNGPVERLLNVKFNPLSPNTGFDPKPDEVIGFAAGEIEWADVETVETGNDGTPKPD